jgi:CheY-like chemotaxis protein
MPNEIAAYYFPSTVFLIDDDAALLSTLLLKLEKTSFYRTSSMPFEALKVLQNTSSLNIAPPQFMDPIEIEEDEANHCVLNLDFNSHLKWLESDRRFQEISVLIVDYTMPGINGIDLVTQLKDKSFKKILLTGEPDQGIAIRAFNEGLIDRYLTKTIDMYSTLNAYIKELQLAYFMEQSASLFNFVAPQNQIAQNDTFKKIFQATIQQLNIVEYYLVNRSGAFLLLDPKGKMYYLDVQSEYNLVAYTDIALGNDAPQAIIARLQNRTAMPIFLNEADEQKTVEDWNLQPAHAIEGSQGKIYYCVLALSTGQYKNAEHVFVLNKVACAKLIK